MDVEDAAEDESIRVTHDFDELYNMLRQRVLIRLDLTREPSDEEIDRVIYKTLKEMSLRYPIDIKTRKNLSGMVFNSLRKLDVLQELIDDEDVTEILINGYKSIFYEKMGQLYKFDKHFSSNEKLEDVIQQIAGRNNKMVNESVPIVDTRLKDGSRVNIVLPPIAIDGAAVSIRRFPKNPITMERLIALGAISKEAAVYLEDLVRAKYNIFISGGTGSGKTTFLNALSGFIPKDERIVTIEDAAELQIRGVPNLVRMETRRANFEGVQEITIRDLIKTALRMRPDRIIVGEVRGAEALDMLQAMQSGHDGSLSTGHADSPEDMIYRLETMVLMGGLELPVKAIRSQIGAGLDVMVHLARMRDKSRKVASIKEVVMDKDGNIEFSPLFEFEETGEIDKKIQGRWVKCNELINVKKSKAAGIRIGEGGR